MSGVSRFIRGFRSGYRKQQQVTATNQPHSPEPQVKNQPFIPDYLEKLLLLESAVGARIGYQLFSPPFGFNPRDTLALNRAAKDIANFAGVNDLLTVAATAHKEACAGHIDLGSTKDGVFIEVAADLLDFPECVLATLAHEISHRYLHAHGLSCGTGPEFHYHNEILTDIAAVFLGLGKLMLNGCAAERSYRENKDGRQQVTTQTRTVGYLEPGQLTFVYLFVCAMRRISSAEYYEGLVLRAIEEVRKCHQEYQDRFFSPKFRRDSIWDELQAALDCNKSESVCQLDLLESELRTFERSYLDAVSHFLKEARKVVEASRPCAQPVSYDPALRFLSATKANLEIAGLIAALRGCSGDAERHRRLLSNLLAVANGKVTTLSDTTTSWTSWFQRLRRKQKQTKPHFRFRKARRGKW